MPGESFSGGWTLGNPLEVRTEDGTHLVLKDGVRVTDSIPLPGAPAGKTDPLESLLLQLDEGAFAAYTVRRVRGRCPVSVIARSLGGGRLEVSEGGRAVQIEIPAGRGSRAFEAPELEEGDARTVRLRCTGGSVQVEKINFA